jgi:flavorubredoxin
MGKVLIAFTTRTDETLRIADLIAEGIRFSGHEAIVRNIKDIKSEKELAGFDGYVFGSPTYHGDMLPAMKTFLFLAEKGGLGGKLGGAFGAHGWSTEAQERIFDTMQKIFQMTMVSGPLLLKSSALGGGMQMAQDYGREIAAQLK